MTITIDNTAVVENVAHSNTITLSGFNTSDTDDVIVLVVITDGYNTAFAPVSSVSDTDTLTWHFRGAQDGVGAQYYNRIETWWAHAPAALVGDDITVDFSTNFDNVCVLAIAINGLNVSSPFDSNGSVPAGTEAPGSGTYPDVVFSTSEVPDFILGVVCTSGTSNGSTPGGYTLIANLSNLRGTANLFGAVWYKVDASSITNEHFQTTGDGNPSGIVAFVDALTASLGAVPVSGSLMALGVG